MSAAPPVPVPDDQTAGFWAAVAARQLVVQRCADCGATYLPPRYVCERCAGSSFAFVATRGEATINSVTFVHAARHPAFEARVPYPIVLVTLDEHPEITLLANMPGTPAEDIVVGRAVEFQPHEITAGHWIPEFRLRGFGAKR